MKIIAHRGLSSIAPENTLKAFELAGKEQHFFGIECDIHETKDHEFVVMHDGNLKRTALVDQNIKDLTLDELNKIKIKTGHGIKIYPNEKIPTLEEYLELCVYFDKTAVIEIKEVYELTSLTEVVNRIENHPGLKAIIISFNINYLKYVRALNQTIELQLLSDKLEDSVIYDARVNQIDLSLWHEVINREVVQKLKKEGFKIALFTVDDPKLQIEYAKMGVDYLTTNQK